MSHSRRLLGALAVVLAATAALALVPSPGGTAGDPARPFGGGQWEQVIWRDYCDIRNRPPSAKEVASAIEAITRGNPSDDTKEDRRAALAQKSVDGASDTFLGGVIRQYWAYFDRDPDTGLAFWLKKRARGEATLATVSAWFSRSSEFRYTYGQLNDRAFVRLVYKNVMGREPDDAGTAYWLGRLAHGTKQSDMMLQFSESREFKIQRKPRADIHIAFVQMIGRPATPAEVLRLQLQVPADQSRRFRLAYFTLVDSPEYNHLTTSRPRGYCVRR